MPSLAFPEDIVSVYVLSGYFLPIEGGCSAASPWKILPQSNQLDNYQPVSNLPLGLEIWWTGNFRSLVWIIWCLLVKVQARALNRNVLVSLGWWLLSGFRWRYVFLLFLLNFLATNKLLKRRVTRGLGSVWCFSCFISFLPLWINSLFFPYIFKQSDSHLFSIYNQITTTYFFPTSRSLLFNPYSVVVHIHSWISLFIFYRTCSLSIHSPNVSNAHFCTMTVPEASFSTAISPC